MNVLGISGSPKLNGLTNLLLDKALEGARASGAHTEKIVLNDLNFRPCQECGGCDKTGACILGDDMGSVYESLAGADVIIMASPIYFSSLTAQLKAMIDRCHSLWVSKYILKNIPLTKNGSKGLFLCVGGRDSGIYFEDAKKIIKAFFATLDVEYSSDLFIGGLNMMPANSPKRDAALEKAFQLGVDAAR
jgi:multimeric flavodoxin WrbA